MKIIKFIIAFTVLFLLLVSCKKVTSNKNNAVRDTLAAMQTHCIHLNLNKMMRCYPDNDTIRHDIQTAKYRLIAYVDSAKCTPCIINKMFYWNDLIENTRASDSDIKYIFIFEPKTEQIEDAYLSVKSSGLINEIYLDTACTFRKDNAFIPNDEKFQTMLVDEKGHILIIGNPLTNHKIKELFLQIIKVKP